MANFTDTSYEAHFNEDAKFYKDVYIYGKLYYDFESLAGLTSISADYAFFNDLDLFNLNVSGIATFGPSGMTTFQGNNWFSGITTFIGPVDMDYLTVRQIFNIGVGGTTLIGFGTEGRIGIANTEPYHRLQVGGPNTLGTGETDNTAFVVTGLGTVGIGTTAPGSVSSGEGIVKLEVSDSIKIDRNIYDSAESPGENGYYLNRDANGIRWIEGIADHTDGIYVQDDGTYLPNTGTARTFTVINFTQANSLGVGVDPVTATPNSSNPVFIADVQLKDFWGHTGSDIYRMTKVGINNNSPSYQLDISGDIHATGAAQFDDTLQVEGATTLNDTLDVAGVTRFDDGTDSSSTTSGSVQMDGGVGIVKRLNVGGDVKFDSQLEVDGNTDLDAELDVQGDTNLQAKLDVAGATKLQNTLEVDGESQFDDTTDASSLTDASVTFAGGVSISKKLKVGKQTEILDNTPSTDKDTGALVVEGGVGIEENLFVGNNLRVVGVTNATSCTAAALVVDGGAAIQKDLWVCGDVLFKEAFTVEGGTFIDAGMVISGFTTGTISTAIECQRVGIATTAQYIETNETEINQYYYLPFVENHTSTRVDTVGIGETLRVDYGIRYNPAIDALNVVGILTVGAASTFHDTVALGATVYDVHNDKGAGVARTDYRLSSVGTGVSWRPSGVETENAIWVTQDGWDTNSGLLEGDAKRSIGAAAEIAQPGDTIIVRSGVYKENNPIGLRTEVTVSGEDLRLVTVVPLNEDRDVFHVRAGCLVQNLNFAGETSSKDHPGCGAVAFPPIQASIDSGLAFQAATGFTELGPANEGPSRINPNVGGRFRSPYVRNCTNFMTGSIGMKIDGNHVDASYTGTNNLGQDFKSMVCDSFTQYNENGIGVSITNNAYAQLVSIFTIANRIAIYCDTGGQCDLTNSNSSFGNYGLYADGVGAIEYTGTTSGAKIAEQDSFLITNTKDTSNNIRKPFDGQCIYFKVDLDDYQDVSSNSYTAGNSVLTQPFELIRSIKVLNGGNPGDYTASAPPNVTISTPLGPESIRAELSVNVSAAGTITSVDVISSGRNFLPTTGSGPTQNVNLTLSGIGAGSLQAEMDPIYYTVNVATEGSDNVGLSTVTLNEFVPYAVADGTDVEFKRISRIITSSHSFEYVGAGTDINRANPFQGGEPVPENEIVAINGGQVPFTSTDQKGNFRIGEGLVIDQTTSTIRGRDFNRAIQAQLTPLILALR